MPRPRKTEMTPIATIAAQTPRLTDVAVSFGAGTATMDVPRHVDDMLDRKVQVLITGRISKTGKSRSAEGEDTTTVTVSGDIRILNQRQAADLIRGG